MGSLGGCIFWEKSKTSATDYKDHTLHSLPEGTHAVPYSTNHFLGFLIILLLQGLVILCPLSLQPVTVFLPSHQSGNTL